MTDALQRAHAILGLELGASPLAARRRYRELIHRWHPDRFAGDPQAAAEANEKTAQINAAYRLIRDAARHRELPLRPPAPAPRQADGPDFVPLSVDTLADRAMYAILGGVLGLLVAWFWGPESASTYAVAAILGAACAAVFGERVLKLGYLLLWWLP